jgi:hypothetical protein
MITPLPEKIPTSILSSFEFGEVEPSNDDLLLACYCDTPPIERFLTSNRSIILGGKGTGKTALFTLLKQKDREFINPKKAKQRIIPIDTDIEYTRLRYTVLKSIKSDIPDEDIQFRYLWEIYVLYRVINELKRGNFFLDAKAKKDTQAFLDIFDPEKKNMSLFDFLTSIRGTVGIRLDTSNPAFPTPDVYISVEPNQNPTDQADRLDVSLSDLKKYVNETLATKKEFVYVIVDNIDDFVAREEYEIQKLLLQGLLQCTRTYTAYNHIKLKLFLRTDLFNNINFSQVGGYDKIAPITEKLVWRKTDIWTFIGERVLWNLSHSLNIKNFDYTAHSRTVHLEAWDQKKPLIEKLLQAIGLKRLIPRDKRDSPDISLRDEAFTAAITTIFPRQIKHYLPNGNVEEMDIFEFLDTHFRLGNGELTPRIFIIYIRKVFELSVEHYEKNNEPYIERDENGEYPLIKRREMLAAYGWLQSEMVRIFLGSVTNNEWRNWLEIFLKKKGRKTTFSYRLVRKTVGVGDNVCIKEFLSFLCHLGVLDCRDKSVSLERRHYELPILLRNNHALAIFNR